MLNPRDMHYGNNKFNFPSKFWEHLTTGKLIFSTKFTGWEKFEDNACFVDSEPESLAKKMRFIIGQVQILSNEYFVKIE